MHNSKYNSTEIQSNKLKAKAIFKIFSVEAEQIMSNEVDILGLPFGLPSLTPADLGRFEDEKKSTSSE